MGIFALTGEESIVSIDVVKMLTPIMNDALQQITGMITSLMPFVITVALVSAGIYLVKNFIHNGTRSIG